MIKFWNQDNSQLLKGLTLTEMDPDDYKKKENTTNIVKHGFINHIFKK